MSDETDRTPESISRWREEFLDAARQHEAANKGTSGPPKSRWWQQNAWMLRGAAAALAVMAIGAVLLVSNGSDDGPAPSVEFAEAAVRTAEVNPRVLVSAPGWEISHVEPLTPNSGETVFSNGTDELDITWYPARFYDDYRRDRSHQPGPDIPVEVLGTTGTMVQYEDSTDFATMLPPNDDVFIEIRGDLGSEEAYRDILKSLESTDVDTWLAAMPAEIVQPGDQPQLVNDLLKGVPLPPGFDREKLGDQAILNPDGVRYEVARQVACGWLDSYAAADKSGDEVTKAAAVEAMRTAPTWAVLNQNPTNGSTRKNILQLADDIARSQLDTSFGGAATVDPNGKTFEFGPAYALMLSCDSITKRETDEPFG